METQVSLRNEFLNPTVWKQIEEVAARLQKSGALPSSITNGAQLTMVFLAGYEAGMKPMESLNAFYIVNGKLTMYGDAVIRQLKRNGYKVAWIETTDKLATVKLTSPGIGEEEQDTHTETFTIEDATRAGLAGKATWKAFPKDQLRWKAVGRAIRFFCPEVLGGVSYLKEEAEDFEVIEAKSAPAASFSEDKIPMTDEQSDKVTDLITALKMPMETANGWSMGAFQCPIDELSIEQAPKAIAALAKRLELANLTKPITADQAADAVAATIARNTDEALGFVDKPITAEEVAQLDAEAAKQS